MTRSSTETPPATSSPSDELRQAAATLRALAEVATPGPWDREMEPRHIRGNGGRNFVTDTSDGVGEYANAAYIATMHPGVGLAFADVLDIIAYVKQHEGESDYFALKDIDPSLAIARLINGASE